VPVRLVHVSDLHVGAHDEGRQAVERALRDLVERERPSLVVASGDLTHRNRREQHDRVAALLRSLGPPVLAVPGNHDIPMLPPGRFLRTFARFEHVWTETEPAVSETELVACGLNSVRPWLYQEGVVRAAQIERAARAFSAAPPGALRVAVLHHHLVSAPWRTAKRPVFRRTRVLAALAEAGAELVLSGHVHQSVVVERREFSYTPAGNRSLVVAVAAGLGRPRPGRHAEASGLHLHEADADWLCVRTFAWDGADLVLAARRRFPRNARVFPASGAVDDPVYDRSPSA
jgi:3',5'-cyclic AMP phosphodiesterase CpdA